MNRIPFNPNELDVIGNYPSLNPVLPPPKKFNRVISPKENYLALVKRKEKPLWIPTAGDTVSLAPRIIPDNIARAFVMDKKPLENPTGGKDMFGIEWEFVPVAGGSMVKPGAPALSDANDWESVIKFPNIDEWDWEGSARDNAEIIGTDRVVMIWFLNGLFERLISFMDFEGAAIALLDEDQKDAVHALFDRLTDLYDGIFEKFKKYYNPDVIYFHDDWSSQRAPFFSLATAREMLVPYMKKLVESCHKRDMLFEFHSCGKAELLVPAMIEAGMDIWNGQPMNDKHMVAEKYSDQIVIGFEARDLGLFPETATPETAVATATSFVEKYAKDFPEKRVITTMMGGLDEFPLTIYELSRKSFDV